MENKREDSKKTPPSQSDLPFEQQTSPSTADASPARNEILEQHSREHPEGDPAVRRKGPIREEWDQPVPRDKALEEKKKAG